MLALWLMRFLDHVKCIPCPPLYFSFPQRSMPSRLYLYLSWKFTCNDFLHSLPKGWILFSTQIYQGSHVLWGQVFLYVCFLIQLYWGIIVYPQTAFLLFKNFYLLFIWLHWVLVAARGLFIVARGLSNCGAWAPERRGSVVAACWAHGMWDLSSPTRDRTHVPCIGRRILNHWTNREIPAFV